MDYSAPVVGNWVPITTKGYHGVGTVVDSNEDGDVLVRFGVPTTDEVWYFAVSAITGALVRVSLDQWDREWA